MAAASLLAELTESGSRTSTGAPNAGGVVYFYQAGTTSQINVYSDDALTAIVSQPLTLDSGGRVPRADYPDGVWATRPVRVYVEDADGNVVSDSLYIPGTAGNVSVGNSGWPDETTLDGVLSALKNSLGGTNANFKIAAGATNRAVKDKLSDIGYSPMDYGAAGNGIAVDTSAVQAAINAAIAAGGGVVDLGSHDYKIDQALTLTSAVGITVRGAGMAATTITSTHATANVFTVSTGTSLRFEDFNVTNSATSTGYGFSLTTVTGCVFSRVGVDGITLTGTYARGISAASSSYISTYDTRIDTNGGTGIVLLNTSNCTFYAGVNGDGFNYDGTTSNVQVIALNPSTFVSTFAAGLTGSRFTYVACKQPLMTVTTTTNPSIERVGAYTYGAQFTSTTAGSPTLTPAMSTYGNVMRLTANAGGAGTINVAAPTVAPTSEYGVYLTLILGNAAGGAVTWAMASGSGAYKLVGGTAPVGTDGTTSIMVFLWDPVGVFWREVSRANSVT